MSVTTIQIPADRIDPIRESLAAARHDLAGALSHPGEGSAASAARLGELDEILGQIDSASAAGGEPLDLTGSRKALWDAVYDDACRASERLAEDCNDYWRGAIDVGDLEARIAEIKAWLELLEALGPPPGEEGTRT